MIPAVNPAPAILDTSAALIATPLPDTTALRAPASNVPPTISVVQLGDDKPKHHKKRDAEDTQVDDASSSATLSDTNAADDIRYLSKGLPSGATFIAQIIGQSLETNGQLQAIMDTYRLWLNASAQAKGYKIEGDEGEFTIRYEDTLPVEAPSILDEVALENHSAQESLLSEDEIFSMALPVIAVEASEAYSHTHQRNNDYIRPGP